MKITIVEKVKPVPSQKEKPEQSKFAKFGKTVNIQKREDLYNYVTQYAWSPSVFKDNERLSKQFLETYFIALDIDDDMYLSQAINRIKALGYKCIIGTTPSHRQEKNGKVTDRFRLIFPLNKKITKIEDFKATWNVISKALPCDSSCKDPSRFYFACTEVAFIDGDRKLSVVSGLKKNKKSVIIKNPEEYGELSFRTRHFLKHGAKDGNWHQEFLFACRDIKSQGYLKEQAIEMLKDITGTLDYKHDLQQISYVYLDNSIQFEYRERKKYVKKI